MRAQNHKEIYRAYWQFSGYLAICVVIAVFSFYFYRQTSHIEVNKIVNKTEEYDKIYVKQMELISRIDSLYTYTTLFNTNLNDASLLNSVTRRKQDIISDMETMSNSDVRLYRKLTTEFNTFLGIKDSIRLLNTEEELVRSDLMKCMEENRNTTRKLRMGGIIINK